MGILARHEGGPGGGAGRLDVVLVQQDPLLRQLLQAGAVDVGVVPGDIVPTWGHISAINYCKSFPLSSPKSSATMKRTLGGLLAVLAG